MATTLRHLIPTKPRPSETGGKCTHHRWHLVALDHSEQFVCSILPSGVCFVQPDSGQVGFSEHTPTVGQGRWFKNTLNSCSLPASEPRQSALHQLLSFRRHGVSLGSPVVCALEHLLLQDRTVLPSPIPAQGQACPAELPVESH